MSKDFEKEYIELAQNEIPDLWDRIEAGLTEKSAPENKASITIFLKRYGGLAAAVLCLLFILPAWLLLGQMDSKNSASVTQAEQEAYVTTEASEEAYDAAAAETTEETNDMSTEAAAEEVYDMAEAGVRTENAPEESETADLTRAMAETETASGATSMEEKKQETTANVLKNVTVQVIKEDNNAYKTEGSSLLGTVYTVIICHDPSDTLKKGEEIEVYLSAYSSVRMAVGNEFEIDIACENDGDYQFVVEKIHLNEKI